MLPNGPLKVDIFCMCMLWCVCHLHWNKMFTTQYNALCGRWPTEWSRCQMASWRPRQTELQRSASSLVSLQPVRLSHRWGSHKPFIQTPFRSGNKIYPGSVWDTSSHILFTVWTQMPPGPHMNDRLLSPTKVNNKSYNLFLCFSVPMHKMYSL